MIEVKILCCRTARRVAVKQRVIDANRDLIAELPDLEIRIKESKGRADIKPMLLAPYLVVNEEPVREGRFPTEDEIIGWSRGAVEA